MHFLKYNVGGTFVFLFAMIIGTVVLAVLLPIFAVIGTVDIALHGDEGKFVRWSSCDRTFVWVWRKNNG